MFSCRRFVLFFVLLCIGVRGNDHIDFYGIIFSNTAFTEFTKPAYDFLYELLHVFATGSKLTANCREDTKVLLRDAAAHEYWALQVLDSMGKPESGILQGGDTFLGDFSQCLSVKGKQNIRGKYCLVHLKYNEEKMRFFWNLTTSYSKMGLGICIPDSCSQNDVSTAVTKTAHQLFPGADVHLQECFSTNTKFDSSTGTWFVILLFATILLLTVVGTLYDLMNRRKKKQPASKSNQPKNCVPKGTDTPSTSSVISTNSYSSAEILCKNKSKTGLAIIEGILYAFSVPRNAKIVLNVKTPSKQDSRLGALHGIRFLSMGWIIVGHSLAFAKQWLYFKNPSKISETILSQPIANGIFAVDTFFFLSGFLVAYTLLKKMKSNKGRLNLPSFYLHRYLRMTPVMMIMIAFTAAFLRYTGAGPSWWRATVMYDTWCRRNWWINILYLQNFIGRENMCFSHTWYSATDMQFYLVAPLIIFLSYKHAYAAATALVVPLFITTVLPIVLTFLHHLPAGPSEDVPTSVMNTYYGSYYIKPYCRMGPYLVGIALGYLMHLNSELGKLSKCNRVFGWTAAIMMSASIMYYMGRTDYNSSTETESALKNGFARTFWAIVIAWVVYACASGQAKTLNAILCSKFIIPLSKLTYAAYIVHPVIMAWYYGTTESAIYFSWPWMVVMITSHLIVTYLIAFFLSILFELPVINIERFFKER